MSISSHALRKAALLIQSLDTATADVLLAQMPPSQARAVLRAANALTDVQPAERDEVIAEFMQSTAKSARQLTAREESLGIELDDSLARKLTESPPEEPANEQEKKPAEPPFRFLHQANGETLSPLLAREHPQTVAVVLAHLPPGRAAEVLARLPGAMQADVMRRVVNMDRTDPEVLRELEAQLHDLLADQLHTHQRRSAGLSAMQAILQAANFMDRRDMLTNLSPKDPHLAQRLKGGEAHREGEAPAELRLPVNATSPNAAQKTPPPAPLGNIESSQTSQTTGEEHPSAIIPFDELLHLPRHELARVLQAVDPEVTCMALTGASPALVDRVLRQLPARSARKLRRRLDLPGPLLLSDVQAAQRQVSEVAGRLMAERKVTV